MDAAALRSSINVLNVKIDEAQQRRDLSTAQQLLYIVQQLSQDLSHCDDTKSRFDAPSFFSTPSPSPAQRVALPFLSYGSYVNGYIRLLSEHVWAGLQLSGHHSSGTTIADEVPTLLRHITGSAPSTSNESLAASACSASVFGPLRQAELFADIADHTTAQHVATALLLFQITPKERKLSDLLVGQKRDRNSEHLPSCGMPTYNATTALRSILFCAKVTAYQISMNAAFAMADYKTASEHAQELLTVVADERARLLSIVMSSSTQAGSAKSTANDNCLAEGLFRASQLESGRSLDLRLKGLLVEPLCLLGKINEYSFAQPAQAFHYYYNALVIEPCCASAFSAIVEQAILSPFEQEELLLASTVALEGGHTTSVNTIATRDVARNGDCELYWDLRQVEEECAATLELARTSGSYNLVDSDGKVRRPPAGVVTVDTIVKETISAFYASSDALPTMASSQPVMPRSRSPNMPCPVQLVGDYNFRSSKDDGGRSAAAGSSSGCGAGVGSGNLLPFKLQCRQLLLPVWSRLLFTESTLVVIRCYWHLIKTAVPVLAGGPTGETLHALKRSLFPTNTTPTTTTPTSSQIAFVVSPSKTLALISETTAGIPTFVLQLHAAYQLQGHGDAQAFLRAAEGLFRLTPWGSERPLTITRTKTHTQSARRHATSPSKRGGTDGRRSPPQEDTKGATRTMEALLNDFFSTTIATSQQQPLSPSSCASPAPDVTISVTHISKSCLSIYIAALVRAKDSRRIYDLGHRLQKAAPYSCVTLYTIGCYYLVAGLLDKAGRCFAQAVDVGTPPSSFSLLPFAAAVSSSAEAGGSRTSSEQVTLMAMSANGGGIAASNLANVTPTSGCSTYSAWGNLSIMPEAWAAFAHCQALVSEDDSALHTYRRVLAACPGVGIGGILRDIVPEIRLECEIRERIDQRIQVHLDSARQDALRNMVSQSQQVGDSHGHRGSLNLDDMGGRSTVDESSASPPDAASVRWSRATITLENNPSSPSPLRNKPNAATDNTMKEGSSSTISFSPDSDVRHSVGTHPQRTGRREFMFGGNVGGGQFLEHHTAVIRTGTFSDCYSFLGMHLSKVRQQPLASLALEDSIRATLRRSAMYDSVLARIHYYDEGDRFPSWGGGDDVVATSSDGSRLSRLLSEVEASTLKQREGELVSIAKMTFLHQQTSLLRMPLRAVISLLTPLRGSAGVVAQGDPLVLNELGCIAMDRNQMDVAAVLLCFAHQMLQPSDVGIAPLPPLPPVEECVTADGRCVTGSFIDSFCLTTRFLTSLPDTNTDCILFNLAVNLRQLPVWSNRSTGTGGDATSTYADEALALLTQYSHCRPSAQHAITAIGYTHHLKGSLSEAITYYHRSLTIRGDAFTEELLKRALAEEFNLGSGGGLFGASAVSYLNRGGGLASRSRMHGSANGPCPKFLTDLRTLASGGFSLAGDDVADVPPAPPPLPPQQPLYGESSHRTPNFASSGGSPTAPSPPVQLHRQFPRGVGFGFQDQLPVSREAVPRSSGLVGYGSPRMSSGSSHTPQGQLSTANNAFMHPPPPLTGATPATPPNGPSPAMPFMRPDGQVGLDGGGRQPRQRGAGVALAGYEPAVDVAWPSRAEGDSVSSFARHIDVGGDQGRFYDVPAGGRPSLLRGESYSLPRVSGGSIEGQPFESPQLPHS